MPISPTLQLSISFYLFFHLSMSSPLYFLSLHLSTCSSFHPSVYPSINWSISPSVRVFIFSFFCLFTCLSFHLFKCSSFHLSFFPSTPTPNLSLCSSFHFSVYPPICPSICQCFNFSISLCINLSTFPSLQLSVCPWGHHFICLSVYPPFCLILSIYTSFHLSTCLPFYLFVCPTACLSIHPSIRTSTCPSTSCFNISIINWCHSCSTVFTAESKLSRLNES